jgi:hypothetical protein
LTIIDGRTRRVPLGSISTSFSDNTISVSRCFASSGASVSLAMASAFGAAFPAPAAL